MRYLGFFYHFKKSIIAVEPERILIVKLTLYLRVRKRILREKMNRTHSTKQPRIMLIHNSRRFAYLSLLLLWIGSAIPASGQTADTKTNAAKTKQLNQLRTDIEYLASDPLRGRGVGDDGINLAADYLESRMREIGLNTEIWDGSPRQPFQVLLGAQATNRKTNFVEISTNGEKGGEEKKERWGLANGFGPLAIGTPIGKEQGPLVFAGYGITAEDLNYDDYQGIDTEGAIVVVLRKEPQRNDESSRFNGIENTRYALFNAKIQNAIQHGAAALLMVNDQDSVLAASQEIDAEKQREEERLQSMNQQLAALPRFSAAKRRQLRESRARILSSIQSLEKEKLKALSGVMPMLEAGRLRPGQKSIPVATLGRDVLDQWIQSASKTSLSELEAKIDETGEPASFAFPEVTAALSVGIEPLNAEANNVLGYLEGKGELSDEIIVVGAHYDHVGMGGNGSLAPGTIAVHNGADDNASGTVTMLSIAKQMSARLADTENHRRLVFMGFSAEERGLLGSKHYVKQPRFPLEDTVSMINLDMVGRLNDNELTVYGTGSGKGFDELVDRWNGEQSEPFDLFKMSSGYGPSDHQSFNEVGIPVLFFFTGIHNDYHRPSDDFDKINFGGLTRITDIVSDIVLDLATQETRPEFLETNRRVQIRRQKTAFLGISLQDTEGKVIVAQVTKEGPAEIAGVKTGDQITTIANKKITTASEVTDWVRTQSPGKSIQLKLIRGTETLELTAELGKREAQ